MAAKTVKNKKKNTAVQVVKNKNNASAKSVPTKNNVAQVAQNDIGNQVLFQEVKVVSQQSVTVETIKMDEDNADEVVVNVKKTRMPKTKKGVAELVKKSNQSKSAYVLKIKHFSKKYAGATNYSAYDINLSVEAGKVLGLVGSNGAGKSTTIKSVTGILPFSEGEIFVNGFDVKKQPIEAKSCIGYVPDDHSVYEVLTGREYAEYMGSLFSVPKEEKQKRIEYYAKLFNIEYALDKQIAGYSHGMKQKICLIGSLVHSPKLWILDEPMMGLDPQTMNDVLNCIRDYANAGNAVVFSSHNLDVVEKVCDRVAIIKDGRLAEFFDLKKAMLNPSFSLERLFMEINEVRHG